MASIAELAGERRGRPDILSGTPRAHAIDRWIFVFMATWFIALVLAGFIPSSLAKIEMVRSGLRPPFPVVMHMHAVLMGSFLLLLFAQTWLMATGRNAYHMRLGILSMARMRNIGCSPSARFCAMNCASASRNERPSA